MTDTGSKMNLLLRLEKFMSTNGALCEADSELEISMQEIH